MPVCNNENSKSDDDWSTVGMQSAKMHSQTESSGYGSQDKKVDTVMGWRSGKRPALGEAESGEPTAFIMLLGQLAIIYLGCQAIGWLGFDTDYG